MFLNVLWHFSFFFFLSSYNLHSSSEQRWIFYVCDILPVCGSLSPGPDQGTEHFQPQKRLPTSFSGNTSTHLFWFLPYLLCFLLNFRLMKLCRTYSFASGFFRIMSVRFIPAIKWIVCSFFKKKIWVVFYSFSCWRTLVCFHFPPILDRHNWQETLSASADNKLKINFANHSEITLRQVKLSYLAGDRKSKATFYESFNDNKWDYMGRAQLFLLLIHWQV